MQIWRLSLLTVPEVSVGKDEFIKQFIKAAGQKYVLNISTVDYIKNIAKDMWWNVDKDN